jgi:GTP cyclohydrolase III
MSEQRHANGEANGAGAGAELTIGVVGPRDLVERVMLSGDRDTERYATRLTGAAYRDEQEAADKVSRLGSGMDVCLFASPVPYEYARKAGVLQVPATYVPLNGSALHSALVRACLDEKVDLSRVSLDVVSRADAEEAYSELGISTGQLYVHEEVGSAAAIAAFHERHWRRQETTIALTCMVAVARRLDALSVPSILIRPTGSALRKALRTAALIGAHHRLEEAQLAVIVVEAPSLRDGARGSAPRYWREELRLSVHRLLIQESQRIGAAVTPVDGHSFLVTATRGSVAAATDGFRILPFSGRARAELGVTLEAGIGMGRTTQDAETNARAALTRARSGRANGFALDGEGRAMAPAEPLRERAMSPGQPKGVDTLSRLATKLPDSDRAQVVDAETAAKLLGVTPRTARRLLRLLVEEGLAWPLPPDRSALPGRPRQLYRLIVEKLEPH